MTMARTVLQWVLAGMLVCGLSACGNKGKLKSPSQIQAAEEKKERKRIKLEKKEAAKKKPEQPAEPLELPAESPETE